MESSYATVGDFAVVAIGSSLGGPRALEYIFSALSEELRVAILVSQHMPKGFTKALTARLDALSDFKVMEGCDRHRTQVGEALIAPGGYNMEIASGGYIRLIKPPPKTTPTPSVNYMMKSVAKVYGPRGIGVLLTGMGNDGAEGMKAIKDAGGATIAQDESSCIVYGMPKAAVAAMAVDVVASLSVIPSAIVQAVDQPTRISARFDLMVLEAVDEGLLTLGYNLRQAIYCYVEERYHLKRDRIPGRLEILHGALETSLSTGARVLEKVIAEKLYNKLGMNFENRNEWNLLDYAQQAKKATQKTRTDQKSHAGIASSSDQIAV
jgi:hypothetical protein